MVHMQVGMFAWKMDSRRRLDVFFRFLRFSKFFVFWFFVFWKIAAEVSRGFQEVSRAPLVRWTFIVLLLKRILVFMRKTIKEW